MFIAYSVAMHGKWPVLLEAGGANNGETLS